MSELTSASVPPIGSDDHITGLGTEAIVYADFGCPYCAAAWARIRQLPLRLCFRHFPMASKHPRARALHAAAEAASLQGSFWEMADSLYADRGRVDDPHLWQRAERLGLDLERFNLDRRSGRESNATSSAASARAWPAHRPRSSTGALSGTTWLRS